MKPVRVLFFSKLKEITGLDETERPLEKETTVADFLGELYAEWPALREWDSQVLVAIDLEYTDRDAVLRGGEEVAVMPPVQGG